MTINPGLSEYYALETEGGRIGLAICKQCGAVVLLGDDSCDSPGIHFRWHKETAK